MGEKHTELVHRATRFLRREGCTVVYAEAGGWDMREQPDAIGFTKQGASHVVEVKVSPADFLADSNKGYRDRSVGMGMYRWYMVPDGLVSLAEVPEDHGLVYVRGRIALVQRSPKRR